MTGDGTFTLRGGPDEPVNASSLTWQLAPLKTVDFNGDNLVNLEDLILLGNAWLGSEPDFDVAPPPNGDNIVNMPDFVMLAERWLEGQ